MSFRIAKKSFIDSHSVYNMWMKDRLSIHRIPLLLESREIVSPTTGTKFKAQSIWRSAWMYALDHLDELRNDRIRHCNEDGIPFDEEEFNRDVYAKAKQFYSKTKLRKFIINNPVYGQYYEKK